MKLTIFETILVTEIPIFNITTYVMCKLKGIQVGRQVSRQRGRQVGRHAGRQVPRQAGNQACR